MNIGILSPCDISVFWDYLYEDNRPENVYRESCAPSVNTTILALLKKGHNVTIFTMHAVREVLHLKGPNLQIHVIPSYNNYPFKYVHGSWINAKRVKEVVQNNIYELDVLHAQWTYEYAWAAGNFTNSKPVFCSVRDWAPYIWQTVSLKDKINWTFKWLLNNKVFRNKEINFIANSPYTAQHIKRKWNIDVPMIPNPINSNFIIKERSFYPTIFKIISITQSIDQRKNIEVLLYAFKKFHLKFPSSVLSLVGGDFIENNIEVKKWKSKGLLDGVELIGKVRHDKLIYLLDDSSLLVHPALEETFGNTLIEAMARRVPVLAGINSGAVPYVLDYGNCGCLCDVTSVEDMLDKMIKIYDDKIYREGIILNATNLLLEKYVDQEIIKNNLNLYSEIIKNRLCKK